MDNRFTLSWIINDTEAGSNIKDFLKGHEISKAALTDIKFKGGRILVNNTEQNVRFRLQEGDQLTVIFPEEIPSEGVKGERIPIHTVYEDEYVLVVNKPAGMSTIPSREHPSGSLANALVGHYEEQHMAATAHIVTRLDRDTSGLVLIAKHRHIHHLFSKQQISGQVKRTYEALASGRIQENNGVIEAPIGRKADSIIEREVRADGQYAYTEYRVLEHFSDFTQVELQLKTGRTHQIRVHLSYIGHPLLGDDLYGGPITLIERQALHCRRLTFYHPIEKKMLQFEAPLPNDFIALISESKNGD